MNGIILLPPTDGRITDEDSDDENDRNLNHLTTAQLATECEIVCDRKNSVQNEQNNAKKKKHDVGIHQQIFLLL